MGTTCLVFDQQAEVIGRAYKEFAQHFPRPGWVEHDPAEIWEVTLRVAGDALGDAGVRPGELDAVGITNQRETVCVWDPATGELCTARSCGRTAAPPRAASSCASRVWNQ
jgi:glycerol kinase